MSDDLPGKSDPPQRTAVRATRRQRPGGEAEPRLPSERDESAGSQPLQSPQGQRDMQLAHDDLAAGRIDTDARGAESERAMRRLRDEAPASATQESRNPSDTRHGGAAPAVPTASGRARRRHRPHNEE